MQNGIGFTEIESNGMACPNVVASSKRWTLLLISSMVLLAGCWWDKDKPPVPTPTPTPTPTPAPTYTVGGTVSGSTGSVTLANNGGDSLVVGANGAFTFATSLATGAAYNVTVIAKPNDQVCSVANGSGSMVSSNVTNVAVTCVTNTYTVGGTVSGLIGSLSLTNNGGDTLAVGSNGAFTFVTTLANGAAYNVAVASKPADQNCTVSNGSGTVSGTVSTVAIACDTFRVTADIGVAGGSVMGPDGVQVVIPAGALTQATTIGIARNTAGAPTPFLHDLPPSGSTYEITPHDTLFSKPVLVRFPVAAGTTSASLAISSFDSGWQLAPAFINGAYAEIERNTFSWYTIVGLCYGNSPDPYPCTYPRGFSFVTATPANSVTMTSGTSMVVQTGSGFPTVSGSAGTWAVNSSSAATLHFTLIYNGAPDCGNGYVTLVKLRPGTTGLLIVNQPTSPNVDGDGSVTLNLTPQQLELNNAGTSTYRFTYHCTRPGYGGGSSRSFNGGDWITLNASATGVPGFTIGGTISGLGSATGLELRNATRDSLSVQANSTNFTFGTPIVPGLGYNVFVLKQPVGRSCSILNGSGTVAADVSNIAITCVPTTPTPPAAGRLVLVPNTASNNISIYRRDATGAALTPLGTVATGAYPFSIVATPDGNYAYASNLVGGSIASFAIDKAAGTLTPISGTGLGTMNPYGVAMDPRGRFIWVANYSTHTASAFAINATTGALTLVGSYAAGTYPYAIAVHPNGTHVYVVNESSNSVSMFSVNGSTGALTSIGALSSVAFRPHSIAVTPNGNFAYSLNNTDIAHFTINSSTGALTSTGYTPFYGTSSSGSAHGIAVHPTSSLLFVCNQNSVFVYAIHDSTGALTLVGTPTVTGSGTNGLALDPSGEYLYVVNAATNTLSIFSVDIVNRTITARGTLPTGNSPQGIATAL